MYSLEYVVDFANDLAGDKVDGVTIRFGDEFPARFDFERTAEETTLYEGTYFIAPRIKSGDSP